MQNVFNLFKFFGVVLVGVDYFNKARNDGHIQLGCKIVGPLFKRTYRAVTPRCSPYRSHTTQDFALARSVA